jgi:hypothetical protein
MGKLSKSVGNNQVQLLNLIWQTVSDKISDSHLDWIQGRIKQQQKWDKEKSMGGSFKNKSSYFSGAGETPELREAMKNIPTKRFNVDKKDGE